MANDYFTNTSNVANFTRARASAVNTLSAAIEAAFDLIPTPASMAKVIKPAVATGGTANAITVANADTISSYATGQKIAFTPSAANTGAVTVDADGVGAVSLLRADGSALEANDLVAGRMYEAMYDGSAFQLLHGVVDTDDTIAGYLSSISSSAGATSSAATTAASAATAAGTAQTAAEAAQAAAEAAAAALTPSALLTSILTVDGNGSGLDADLLRGTTPGAGGLAVLDDASIEAVRATLSISNIADDDIAITGVLSLPDGSAAAPALTNTGDTDTGIYFSGADEISISCGGSQVVAIGTSAVTLSQRLLMPAGFSSIPSVSFANDTDTGFYLAGGNEPGITAAGNSRLFLLQSTRALFYGYQIINLQNSKTPTSAGATGTAGDICWDTSYIYVCVSTNTWKRAALSTW